MTNLEVFTERLERQKADREKFLESVSPKNFKAALVTCQGCGSKIAKQFFTDTNCPLCGASMLSESNKNRLESFDKRIATTEANLKQAQERADKRAGVTDTAEESADVTDVADETADEATTEAAEYGGDE